MKAAALFLVIPILIASCATDKKYGYIGEADLRNFGTPQAGLSLVSLDGSDSLTFTSELPRWNKRTTTTSQWHGLRRSVRETESCWFTYNSNQGYGNIHIGLEPEETTPNRPHAGKSMLHVQLDFPGGSFFRVYCRQGGILPESPYGEFNVSHTPSDTIHINGRSFTGFYRITQPSPLPVWKMWKAVWIKPGLVPAALESADGRLYFSR